MADGTRTSCGCCDGIAVRAPVEPGNAPLLPAISYRSGDWQSFRDTMLARLSSADAGALAGLTIRDTRDPTIALIDAWAAVGDILTFYNERLMSEGLLRTAEELDSLHQLARLIGYQPGPGVAASADIAFTMDSAPGAPASVVLTPGIKVQSTPAQDQAPVTYETIEGIEARPAWNAIRPQLEAPQVLTRTMRRIWIEGTSLSAAAGDMVFFDAAGGPFLSVVTRIERLAADRAADPDARDFTLLWVEPVLTPPLVDDSSPVLSASIAPPEPALSYLGRILSAAEFAAEVTAAGHDEARLFEVYGTLEAVRPTITLLRAHAPVFGHAAPPFSTLPPALTGTAPNYEVKDGVVVANGVIDGPFKGQSAAWADGALAVLDTGSDGTIFVEGAQPLLANGSTVILRDGDNWGAYTARAVAETSLSRFTVSGKAMRLQLSSRTGFDRMTIRGTTVHFAAETVTVGRPRLSAPVSDGSSEPMRLHGYAPGLQVGRRIALTGRRVGDGGAGTTAMATLDEVTHDFSAGGGTAIRFSPALPGPFLRDSVRINANVAKATHGESVAELLGDGDATVPFLGVTLKQAPQTHVTDSSASGAAPTLEVRVNDIRWARVDNLLGSGPQDRVHTTSTDAAGRTTVRFGDGINGARPPTGRQNLRATYRKGLGLAGRVAAGQLNVLMSRPLGLIGAVNSLPSSGGADPEPPEGIRQNAPLTVRTLDRAVSAIDFQDFAQGYAGVAKAEARLLVNGVTQTVHLTVAGEEGEQILPGTALHDGLSAAIASHADPYRRVLVSSHRPATFHLGARIKVDPDFIAGDVLAAVRDRLRDRFGFAARSFSQAVWMSEIMAEIHAVPGVVAVDMTGLWRDFDPDGNPQPEANLPGLVAEGMRLLPDGSALGAELLTLHPGALDRLVILP